MTLYGRIEKAILEIEGGYGAAGVLQGFKAEIDDNEDAAKCMYCFENAGVDNWSGYEYAQELRAAQLELDKETT
jgi:hypothetical protein